MSFVFLPIKSEEKMKTKDTVYRIRLWTRQGSNFTTAICDSLEAVTECLFTHGDLVNDELEREFFATYPERRKVIEKLETVFNNSKMDAVELKVRFGQEASSYIVDAWPLLTVSDKEETEK